jgi:hypothetical protein
MATPPTRKKMGREGGTSDVWRTGEHTAFSPEPELVPEYIPPPRCQAKYKWIDHLLRTKRLVTK